MRASIPRDAHATWTGNVRECLWRGLIYARDGTHEVGREVVWVHGHFLHGRGLPYTTRLPSITDPTFSDFAAGSLGETRCVMSSVGTAMTRRNHNAKVLTKYQRTLVRLTSTINGMTIVIEEAAEILKKHALESFLMDNLYDVSLIL